MRGSTQFTILISALLLLLAGTLIDARLRQAQASTRLAHEQALTRMLGLSDLVLATEARYTRHLSQADFHAAFQDHPAALDHFPSGSVFAPPTTLRP